MLYLLLALAGPAEDLHATLATLARNESLRVLAKPVAVKAAGFDRQLFRCLHHAHQNFRIGCGHHSLVGVSGKNGGTPFSVESETTRPPQTEAIRSSLLTTRSRFSTR